MTGDSGEGTSVLGDAKKLQEGKKSDDTSMAAANNKEHDTSTADTSNDGDDISMSATNDDGDEKKLQERMKTAKNETDKEVHVKTI